MRWLSVLLILVMLLAGGVSGRSMPTPPPATWTPGPPSTKTPVSGRGASPLATPVPRPGVSPLTPGGEVGSGRLVYVPVLLAAAGGLLLLVVAALVLRRAVNRQHSAGRNRQRSPEGGRDA